MLKTWRKYYRYKGGKEKAMPYPTAVKSLASSSWVGIKCFRRHIRKRSMGCRLTAASAGVSFSAGKEMPVLLLSRRLLVVVLNKFLVMVMLIL